MNKVLLQRKVIYGSIAGTISVLPGVMFIGERLGVVPEILQVWSYLFWFVRISPLLIGGIFFVLFSTLIVISLRIAEVREKDRRTRAFKRLCFYGLVVVFSPLVLWLVTVLVLGSGRL